MIKHLTTSFQSFPTVDAVVAIPTTRLFSAG